MGMLYSNTDCVERWSSNFLIRTSFLGKFRNFAETDLVLNFAVSCWAHA